MPGRVIVLTASSARADGYALHARHVARHVDLWAAILQYGWRHRTSWHLRGCSDIRAHTLQSSTTTTNVRRAHGTARRTGLASAVPRSGASVSGFVCLAARLTHVRGCKCDIFASAKPDGRRALEPRGWIIVVARAGRRVGMGHAALSSLATVLVPHPLTTPYHTRLSAQLCRIRLPRGGLNAGVGAGRAQHPPPKPFDELMVGTCLTLVVGAGLLIRRWRLSVCRAGYGRCTSRPPSPRCVAILRFVCVLAK